MTGAPFYLASSLEDGSYSVAVRQSTTTTYRVYAYYTTYNTAGTPTVNTLSATGIGVLSGQTVTPTTYPALNFSW